MTPYYADDAVTLWHGDCLEVLRALPDASVDAVVTDPPYGLEFMGKEWDAPWRDSAAKFREPTEADEGFRVTRGSLPDAYRAGAPFQSWCEQWATECLRVLKPGGHLLAFGGTRTSHRLACAIEDAGFEIRDSIMWIYASGFPKSHNVTKALDHLVPADARCACAQRSTRTAQDSQGGYPSSHGSGDARPRPGEGSARSSAPSRADAPERTHAGRRAGGPASAPANTSPGGASDRPSIGRSAPLGSQSEPSRDGEHESSDTRTSTSVVPGREHRRTPDRTPYTSGSAAGSASAYAPHQYMACPDCGKVRVPQGLGTALKPAHEPVVVARKPLAGTVASNVLAHGTGALNIDGCRIGTDAGWSYPNGRGGSGWHGRESLASNLDEPMTATAGRWPANVILDEPQAAELDRQVPNASVNAPATWVGGTAGSDGWGGIGKAEPGQVRGGYGDTGGASRFFKVIEEDSWTHDPASTAGRTSPPPSASDASAPSGAATSERPDTERPTGSPSTSATPSASRPSGASGTTTPTDGARLSSEPLPGGRTPTRSRASDAATNVPTGTTTTTTSPSSSSGSVGPATSSDTSNSKERGEPLDEVTSRFIYCAKAPTTERPRVKADVDDLTFHAGRSKRCVKCGKQAVNVGTSACSCPDPDFHPEPPKGEIAHPTVKPLDLMRWLVRLVTPPGGTVLEPFAGSGTTAEACVIEGFKCIAIEREADYLPLIVQRLTKPIQPDLFGGTA